MIFGSIESARAMPTRCFMPPDSCAGRLCSEPVRPDQVDELLTCARTFALLQSGQRDFDGKGDVAHDRQPRQQRMALEDHGAVEAGAGDFARRRR